MPAAEAATSRSTPRPCRNGAGRFEYASFTCPHCAPFHANLVPQLKADYIDTGKVRFVYREVYFDRFGLWASMVARCGGPDRFFGIVDLIYDSSPNGPKARSGDIADNLRRIGRTAGLTNEEIDACLTRPADGRGAGGDLRGEHGGARHQRHADAGHQRRDA
jgi:hypothetical protein